MAQFDGSMEDDDQRQVLTLTYLYTVTSFGYYVTFAPVFIFYAHKLFFGLVHIACAILVALLFVHLHATKKVKFASYGVVTIAALVVLAMVFEGGIDHSGIYFVMPVAILLFFLPSRRYSLTWIGVMLLLFLGAAGMSSLGYIKLAYSNEDFILFIASFASSVALLVMYAREKDKLDKRLKRSLKEIQLLAKSLEREKERVEEKVQLRTQQYRKERAKLEASIDSLRIGFIILDKGMTVLSVNDAGKKILLAASGDKLEDLPASMSMSDIVSHLSGVYDIVAKAEKCMEHKKPIMARDVHFGSRYVAVTITPVIDGNQTVGVVILLEDTTDSKALERSRDEFFSIASHELRTPLTSIVGNASIAQQYYDRMDEDEVKGMLSDINSSGKRLICIVNDFLDVSHIEQGKILLKLEQIDARRLAQDVIDEMGKEEKIHGLSLTIRPSALAPIIVTADHDRLKQILINLVGNAIKYTDKGGVTVNIVSAGDKVYISVEDTGKGIPKDSQYLLFRKFQQASNNILTRDNSQSTGLGLYISKMLAKAMNGDVYLDKSTSGEGSTFVVSLPAVK